MTLHTELRAALARAAEDLQTPDVDAIAVLASARARRRNRRRTVTGLVVSLLLVAVVVVAAELGTGRRPQAVVPADESGSEQIALDGAPDALWPTHAPYCRAGSRGAADVLHVYGEDLDLPCHHVLHARYWYHQAGTQVLEQGGQVYVLDAASWMPVGSVPGPSVKLSEDGRFVTWLAGASALAVVDVASRHRAELVQVPVRTEGEAFTTVTHIIGTDDLGRVYLGTQSGGILAYDIRRDRWTNVSGLPSTEPEIAYVTRDGLAVSLAPPGPDDPAGRSLEGRVTRAGDFVAVRTVRLSGSVVWADDRGAVAYASADGIRVRNADDPGLGALLDIPGRPRLADGAPWDVSWDGSGAVYLTFTPLPQQASAQGGTEDVVRCDLVAGSCEPVVGIELPMGPDVPQLG